MRKRGDRLGMRLSPTQLRVITLRAQGMTGLEIGHRIGTGEQTVKNHLWEVYRRLGVDNSIEAFVELGWLRVPDHHHAHPIRDGDIYPCSCGSTLDIDKG